MSEIEKEDKATTKLRRRELMFVDVISNNCIAMQSAVIEARVGGGLEAGMRWIENTLFGPGLYPDLEEAQSLGGAQAWFDRETAQVDVLSESARAPDAVLAVSRPMSADELRLAQLYAVKDLAGIVAAQARHIEHLQNPGRTPAFALKG